MDDSLQVEHLSASWKKTPVLRNASLSVSKGEFVCLCGPNGSGKSTLLSVIAGIHAEIAAEKESVSFAYLSPKERARIISYMQQTEFSAWNHTVRELVLTGRFAHTHFSGFYTKNDYMVTDETIKRVQIENLAEKRVHEISGGEFQKARIARCLAQETPFMLLDEPAANLDFSCQEQILSLLKSAAKERNAGILISIHDINTAARFADKIVLLPKLEPCISGTPQEIMTDKTLSAVYKAHIQICTHPVHGSPMAVFL